MMGYAEQKSREQLWKELLENINKQLDANTKLKEILESVAGTSSAGGGLSLNEETADGIKDLIIENESLQAEGKAVFHQLFGVDADAE